MINNIEKTFPIKMGEITSISGLPFKSKVKSFDSRLKRTFMKVFRVENMDNEYWKILKNMTLNPDEVFGLVAIDGYVHDVWGKDDIALVFNMGIPRLRGRKVHYLDRIYARIEKIGMLNYIILCTMINGLIILSFVQRHLLGIHIFLDQSLV